MPASPPRAYGPDPPVASTTRPVTQRASSEARNATTSAMSSGCPTRPSAAAEADPEAPAGYFGTVLQGMSQQARDGATAADLARTAELALRAWP